MGVVSTDRDEGPVGDVSEGPNLHLPAATTPPRCPTVSICIPLFNSQPRFLEPLFASIAAQGLGDELEVVVIDDASDIDPRPGIGSLQGDLHPVLERNPSNLGMVANWNRAVARSTAELVMLVCQDDVLDDGMVERYVQEFRDDPDVVICGGAEVFIAEHGELIDREHSVTQRSRVYRHRERYELTVDELTRLCLRNGQAFGEPSAVMFRRFAFDRVGGYRSRYEHAPDLDFNLRCAALGIAAYLNHPYLRRRIHPDNLTWGHIASGASSRDRVQFHEEYVPSVDPLTRRRARVTIVSFALNDARRALAAHRWGVARLNLRTAWHYKANSPSRYLEHLWELWTKKNVDER